MFCILQICRFTPFYCYPISETVPRVMRNHQSDYPKCDQYDQFQPLESNLTETCKFEFDKKDIKRFVRRLRLQDLRISLLKLRLEFRRAVYHTECTISYLDWVWTFNGKNGGQSYLHMIKGYEVYSLGLLNTYAIAMPFRIDTPDNCQITVGERNTTGRIAIVFFEALNRELSTDPDSNVRQGFLCYLSRFKLNLNELDTYYIANKQTFGYRCCNTTFDVTLKREVIQCSSEVLLIDNELWWNFPFYIGCLFFAFLPIVILKLFTFTTDAENYDKTVDSEIWIASNPISFSNMLKNIFTRVFKTKTPTLYILKVLSVIITFTFVAIEIALYNCLLNNFIVSSVKAYVLLDWAGMAAGYNLSKQNFLQCFGGPYIALVIYLTTFSIILCLPKDLGLFINRGLDDDDGLSTTLLTIDISTRGRFGSVLNIHRKFGYSKLYAILKANTYMLINPAFWKIALNIQIRRFRSHTLSFSGSKKYLKMCYHIVFTAIYLIICIIEWLLAIILYGLPIFGLFSILLRAFLQTLQLTFPSAGIVQRIIRYTPLLLVTICLLFDLYILSLITIRSCVFICLICTYTFTGFIAYPKITYGYAVFAITVIIYITESIQNIGFVYSTLFNNLKSTCLARTKVRTVQLQIY